MMTQMVVEAIGIDPQNQTLVLLRDEERKIFVPIYIGPAEAMAIQSELDNVTAPRPMTHDLLRNILRDLHVELMKVTITDVDDDDRMLYYAKLHLKVGEGAQDIDSRPSDAIALALRTQCPIWVSNSVLEKNGIQLEDSEEAPADIDKFTRLIEDLDLGDEPRGN